MARKRRNLDERLAQLEEDAQRLKLLKKKEEIAVELRQFKRKRRK